MLVLINVQYCCELDVPSVTPWLTLWSAVTCHRFGRCDLSQLCLKMAASKPPPEKRRQVGALQKSDNSLGIVAVAGSLLPFAEFRTPRRKRKCLRDPTNESVAR